MESSILSPTSVQLIIRDTTGAVARHSIDGEKIVIGRSVDADIRLDNPTISRRHAELKRTQSGLWLIRDLGSHNGVYVNGQKVEESPLPSGRRAQIGDFTVEVLSQNDTGTIAMQAPSGKSAILPVQADRGSRISSLSREDKAHITIEHLELLTGLSDRLMGNPNPDSRRAMVCRQLIGARFGASAAVVLSLDEDSAHAISEIATDDPAAARNLYISRSLIRAVKQRNTPVYATTESGAGSVEVTQLERVSESALMACPMERGDGGMVLLYASFPVKYASVEWLALMSMVAERYTACERAITARDQAAEFAVFERDLEQAKRIQEGLIPKGVVLEGLDVAIRFEPCRWVGGDFIDAVAMPDGRVVCLIADVSGKGLPAALVVSQLHAVIRTSLRAGSAIIDTMKNLNEHLCEGLSDGSFVTMNLLSIDAARRNFECVNGGHPPALLLRRGAAIRRLQASAHFPLGLYEQSFESESVAVQPGDVVALFTDGLTEQPLKNGELLGTDGVIDCLHEEFERLPVDVPLEEVADGVMRAIARRAGGVGADHDDRALLLVRIR